MSLLARFDPGDSCYRAVFHRRGANVGRDFAGNCTGSHGVSVACGGTAHLSGWRSLVLVLLSPAVAAVARRSSFALWAIALPATGRTASPAHSDRRPSNEVARFVALRQAVELSTASVDDGTMRLREEHRAGIR